MHRIYRLFWLVLILLTLAACSYGRALTPSPTAAIPASPLDGEWKGNGVKGPEAFDAVPFLQLLNEHGAPWAMEERAI